MATGMLFQFDASHHAVVNLLGLGTILVLPMARVRLLILQEEGAPLSFQALLAVSSIGAQISKAKAAVQELYTTLGLLPASGVQNGLDRDCAVHRSEAAKL